MRDYIKDYIRSLPNYIDKLKGIRKETHCSLPDAINILYAREKYKNNVDFETAIVFLLQGYEIKSIETHNILKLSNQHKIEVNTLLIDEVRGRWVVLLDNKEIELPDAF